MQIYEYCSQCAFEHTPKDACGACRGTKSCHPYFRKKEPITNADRIRAMSDKELAGMLSRAGTDGRAYGPIGEAAWLDWLKSPAEGGDDHADTAD